MRSHVKWEGYLCSSHHQKRKNITKLLLTIRCSVNSPVANRAANILPPSQLIWNFPFYFYFSSFFLSLPWSSNSLRSLFASGSMTFFLSEEEYQADNPILVYYNYWQLTAAPNRLRPTELRKVLLYLNLSKIRVFTPSQEVSISFKSVRPLLTQTNDELLFVWPYMDGQQGRSLAIFYLKNVSFSCQHFSHYSPKKCYLTIFFD